MNADEARDRGLGAARGCLISLLILGALAFIVWSGVKAAR